MNSQSKELLNTTIKQLDTNYTNLAKSVLESLAEEFAKEQKCIMPYFICFLTYMYNSKNNVKNKLIVTDSILLRLSTVFGGVFERALGVYELGRVTKIVAADANTTGVWKAIDSSRWLIEVRGLTGEAYILFPDINFCRCAAYR